MTEILSSSFRALLAPWVAGVAILIVTSALRSDSSRRRDDFVTAAGYTLFTAAGVQLHALLVRLFPVTMDTTLLAADRALGFNPFGFEAWVAARGPLMALCVLAYSLLPVALAAAWVAEQNPGLRRALLLGGLLCFPFYAAVPACGPGLYDWKAGVPLPLEPRNCVPSMHLTWALLIALYARRPALRVGLWAYAALIALATLATGEHYLTDLLVALPYTLMVCYGEAALRQRLAWSPAAEARS